MPDLIVPNMHPILVHFALALTIASTLAYLFTAFAPEHRLSATLKPAADWMLAFGAVSLIGTVAAGFYAYFTVAHDTPSHLAMTTHRNWAVPTAIVILILAVWRSRRRAEKPGRTFAVLLLGVSLLLAVTAWWGGRLVYGFGLGVSSLPQAVGAGHDHDHGDGHDHAQGAAETHKDDAHAHAPVKDVAQDFDLSSPEGVVDAFHAAMRAGDADSLKSYLLPNVIVAETGGAERSIEEYEGHHMPADMAFTAAVDSSLKQRDVMVDGDTAVVISASQVHGEFRGQSVHAQQMETMVLRKSTGDDQWRIAHIHWSSAPIKEEHEH